MSRKRFLAIETFKVFRKRVVSGNSSEGNEITDSTLVDIIRKWFVPYESGDTTESVIRLQYFDGITNMQHTAAAGKPFMLTSEVINNDEKIVMYTIDPELSSLNTGLNPLNSGIESNPDVTDDGNNKIHKLEGGVLSDEDSGLEWESIVDDGEVSAPDEGPELTDRLHCPFLLFGRKHIA